MAKDYSLEHLESYNYDNESESISVAQEVKNPIQEEEESDSSDYSDDDDSQDFKKRNEEKRKCKIFYFEDILNNLQRMRIR